MVKKTYSGGTGRRKTAVAQVRLSPGTGTITVDGRATKSASRASTTASPS